MTIRIEIVGDSSLGYSVHNGAVQGVVLSWSQTVEYFNGVHVQVPCAIVKTAQRIEIVPLKRQHYETKVTVISDSDQADC
jgi:hypothetical protein